MLIFHLFVVINRRASVNVCVRMKNGKCVCVCVREKEKREQKVRVCPCIHVHANILAFK